MNSSSYTNYAIRVSNKSNLTLIRQLVRLIGEETDYWRTNRDIKSARSMDVDIIFINKSQYHAKDIYNLLNGLFEDVCLFYGHYEWDDIGKHYYAKEIDYIYSEVEWRIKDYCETDGSSIIVNSPHDVLKELYADTSQIGEPELTNELVDLFSLNDICFEIDDNDFAYTILDYVDDVDISFLEELIDLASCYSYFDLSEKLVRCLKENTGIKVFDTMLFGNYGGESIKWRILLEKDKQLFLLSEYAIDIQRYNRMQSNCLTWEKCSLRKWLNDSFFETAFSPLEQKRILSVKVTEDASNGIFYQNEDANSSDFTIDRVFLLSAMEADNCLVESENSLCFPTDYAKSRAVIDSEDYNEEDKTPCNWWLRSDIYDEDEGRASIVDDCGFIETYESLIESDNVYVRPAIWISAE